MQIIDSHTHIFPREIIDRRKTIAVGDPGFAKIYGDPRASMVDHTGLLKYMEREMVSVAVACGFPFEDRGLITLVNDYILDTAKKNPNIIPLASVNTGQRDTGIREAERCLALGAKGVGEVAVYDKGLGTDELDRLGDIAQVLALSGGVLLIHLNEQVGHTYSGKIPVDFGEVTKFVGAHQDVTIILAHLGGGICFYEFMPEIRETFSRVYYDTAAIPYLYSHEVYQYIDTFLPGKMLFGSDYPLLSFKRYDGGINSLDQATREKVLSANARRVFRHG